MKRNYNTQAFTPEEVEQGLLQDLINYLLEYNKKCESGYYDIHITSDSYCTIVEWVDINYEFQYEEGKWDFVDADEEVYKGIYLPDNTTQYVPRSEADKVLPDWLKEHPNWKQDSWGRWYDVDEYNHVAMELGGYNVVDYDGTVIGQSSKIGRDEFAKLFDEATGKVPEETKED